MTKKNITTIPASSTILAIPLDRLKKSPRNARKMPHTKAEIEQLAASLKANGMLQNPVVEPEIKKGKPTGSYLVTAGEGRRLAQLLRAKRKEIAKDEPIRCLVDTEHNALELSLAENAVRTNMHPADQCEAIFALHGGHGMTADDIAAHLGLTPAVVKQRLKLAAVSPVLMQAYRDGDLNLEQLQAYAFTDDHAKQEGVFEALPPDAERDDILAALNEANIEATDPRALFVGIKAYEKAGGFVARSLFDTEHEGYCTDSALLMRLAAEKLEATAQEVRAEGWKWVEVMLQFDHGAVADMRRIHPRPAEPSPEVAEKIADLEAEIEALDGDSDDAYDAQERIEVEIEALQGPDVFAPDIIGRAGVVVAIGHDGSPCIERGFLRREDDVRTASPGKASKPKDGPAPLSEALVAELTGHRTVALRNEVARQPDVALIAVVHAFAAEAFFSDADAPTCLKIHVREAPLGAHNAGLMETDAGKAITVRHEAWAKVLPDDPAALWDYLLGVNGADLLALLAHCASLTLDAVHTGRSSDPARLTHADQLARAVGLDMRQHWQPTPAAYLERVSKERILEAVREGASNEAANNIASLKKQVMAEHAAQRLEGRGWLPAVLRTQEPPPAMCDAAE